MTPRLFLLALLGLLLLAPMAQAQGMASLVVKLEPVPDALAPGEFVVYRGVAEYVVDVTGQTALAGIPIHYTVQDAPSWAAVTISPPTDILVLSPPMGATSYATATFEVIVAAAADAPAPAIAPITIGAMTGSPNPLVRPAYAEGSTPVQLREGPGCLDGAYEVQSAATVLSAGTSPAALLAAPALAAAAMRSRAGRLAAVAVLAAMAGAALAPTAAAQGTSTMVIRLEPLAEPLEAGSHVTLRGTATLVADALASTTQMSGVPVQFDVVSKPAWATVVVTPASDVFVFPQPTLGLASYSTVPITVEILTNASMPRGEFAHLEVAGYAYGNQLMQPAHGVGAAMLATQLPACADESPAAAPGFDVAPAAEETDVTLQSVEAQTERPIAAIVLGCAALGGLVGLALQRRLRG